MLKAQQVGISSATSSGAIREAAWELGSVLRLETLHFIWYMQTIWEHGPVSLILLPFGASKAIFHAVWETKYMDHALQSKQINQPASDQVGVQWF